MLCGLQGTGKTTTCGKLAAYGQTKRGKNTCWCAGADLQRPAAVEQLRVKSSKDSVEDQAKGEWRLLRFMANLINAPNTVQSNRSSHRCLSTCHCKRARSERFDVLILDTAGRLHVDDDLMKELEGVDRSHSTPTRSILVVDAMTGQDAVTVRQGLP